MTSDVANFSDQAHIFVADNRINPPASGDGYDHRALGDINAHGLNPEYAALDTLKPLSETIMHEVCIKILQPWPIAADLEHKAHARRWWP